MRRVLMSALAAALLAACSPPSQPQPAQPGQPGAPPAQAGGAPADAPAWVRKQWSSLPEWTKAANEADGGVVLFSPKSIRRDAAAGTADVNIQIIFKNPRVFTHEDGATVTKTFYFKELATYRFHCQARLFTIWNRQMLDAGDKLLGKMDAPEPAQWAGVDTSAPARIFEGPACKSN